MGTNITKNLLQVIHGFGEIMSLVAFLTGILFSLWALFTLASYATNRGMTQTNIQMLPFIILAAAMCLNFGKTVADAKATLFVSDGSYSSANMPSNWKSTDRFSSDNQVALQARLMLDLMALIGYIAIYRATLILVALSRPSGGGGATFGKFFAFFVGGAALQAPGTLAGAVGAVLPFFKNFAVFFGKAI